MRVGQSPHAGEHTALVNRGSQLLWGNWELAVPEGVDIVFGAVLWLAGTKIQIRLSSLAAPGWQQHSSPGHPIAHAAAPCHHVYNTMQHCCSLLNRHSQVALTCHLSQPCPQFWPKSPSGRLHPRALYCAQFCGGVSYATVSGAVVGCTPWRGQSRDSPTPLPG
jgi:hypothetical protein